MILLRSLSTLEAFFFVVFGDVGQNYGDEIRFFMRDQVETDDPPFRIEHFQFATFGASFVRDQSFPVHPFEERGDRKARGVVRNAQKPGRRRIAVFDLEVVVNHHHAFADGIEDVFQKSFFFRQFVDAFIKIVRIHAVELVGDYFFVCHPDTPFLIDLFCDNMAHFLEKSIRKTEKAFEILLKWG